MIRTVAVAVSFGLVAAASLGAQPSQAQPGAQEKPLGKRLRVELTEVRQRDGAVVGTRPCSVTLHADGESARVFVGAQVALTASDRGATTTTFKDVGVDAQVSARTVAAGRYRLSVTIEQAAVPAGESAGNPVIPVMRSQSALTLGEDETVALATSVDPANGDIVRTDLKLTVAPTGKPTASKTGGEPRLRAALVISRHQGQKAVARRPYSIVLQPDGDTASTFSGSMLPVQTTYQGQPTVMLKDVGAGFRLKAQPTGAGRYRLDYNFSDGTVAINGGSPRVRAFQSESQLVVQLGETILIASAVDPQTGELVEAELGVDMVK